MSSWKWPQNKVTTFIGEAVLTLQIQPQAVNFVDSADQTAALLTHWSYRTNKDVVTVRIVCSVFKAAF